MFYSILFPTKEQYMQPRQDRVPDYFKDLNLDQIINHILMEDKDFWLKGKKEFGLESFLYTPLRDVTVIKYRQDVLQELEDDGLRSLMTDFANTVYTINMRVGMVHSSLSSLENWRDNYLTRGQLLDCAERYCQAITSLSDALAGLTLKSAGLCGFAAYLTSYIASAAFSSMCGHAKRLRDGFSAVEFCMLIKNETIRIRPYEGQADHAEDLRTTFARFCPEDEVWESRLRIPEAPPEIHTEIAVLNMISKLPEFKDVFADLDAFCSSYKVFEDDTITRFSRELQFYLLWLEFVMPMRHAGLRFCYPELCSGAERLYSRGGFDLSLAYKKGSKCGDIVPNDFELHAPERIIVVTGPNQGGKTTYARAFGQTHHLAAVGLCVPGREVSLNIFDTILTHFEREEELATLSGKLQEDLIRLHQLLARATSRSIIIVNEIFASTMLSDALSLGTHMMDALVALGSPAMIVTFLDELASYGPETVSMMSTVSETDPAERTFKIVRKPPDGLAYALHLARKYSLTYEQLSEEYTK